MHWRTFRGTTQK